MNVRDELLKTPDLRSLLDDLEKVWREEQILRHTYNPLNPPLANGTRIDKSDTPIKRRGG